MTTKRTIPRERSCTAIARCCSRACAGGGSSCTRTSTRTRGASKRSTRACASSVAERRRGAPVRRCAGSLAGVHPLDRGGVLLGDRPALELHRGRQLLAARQPVSRDEVELLDLFDARELGVG